MTMIHTPTTPASKNDTTGTDQGPGTRRRLLDTAARLFAEQGYRGVAVRDICEQACANVAAVNYHFGGKGKLYEAALEHARQRAVQAAPPRPSTAGPSTPEDKLRRHLRCTLGRAFDRGPAGWYVRIVLRELVEPTAALKQTIEMHIAPHQRRLEAIIAQAIGQDADSERVKDLASSVLGITLYFHNCQPAIAHLRPGATLDEPAAERLVDTVVSMVV